MCWAVQKELEGHRPAMVPTRSHPILAMRAQCLCGAVTWSWCSVTLREELMGRISASSRFPPATIIQASEFLAPDWHSEKLPPPFCSSPRTTILFSLPRLCHLLRTPLGWLQTQHSFPEHRRRPACLCLMLLPSFFFFFTDTVVEIC